MVEDGAGEDDAVGVSDGDADGVPGAGVLDGARGGRAVQEDRLAVAGDERRHDVRLPVDLIADVADHRRVDDGKDLIPVIQAPVGLAQDFVAWRNVERGHRLPFSREIHVGSRPGGMIAGSRDEDGQTARSQQPEANSQKPIADN